MTPEPAASAKVAYLVSHGWHVGLVGAYRYLEVGWGDGDYYRAARGSVGLALKAAFRSESTVLHVAAFNTPIASFFGSAQVVAIALSASGFEELTRFIHAAYARDASGRPAVVPVSTPRAASIVR